MERRTFLKGMATLPTISLPAPVPAETRPVWDLITDYADAKAAARNADQVWDEIFERPDRPAFPCVAIREVSPLHRSFPYSLDDELSTTADINEFIERRVFGVRMMRRLVAQGRGGVSPRYQAQHDHKLAEIEAERRRLIALLEDRQAVYRRWELDSGCQEAEDEAERLWNVAFGIEDAVLNFDCQTIEDVRAVAGYIRQEYGDKLSEAAANRFIARLAGSSEV